MKLNRGINNLFLIATMCSGICGWAQGPIHQNNAAFLGHAYVTTASYIYAPVSTDASNLQFSYGTNVLFVNCGTINSSGQLTNGAASVPQAAEFLNAIANWENANGKNFLVFAYLNGNLDSTAANFIDVSQTTVQANLAIESTKFTSTGVSGSYIAGASRSFDGILIDFEPSGGTSIAATAQFNNLETTMDQIAAAIGSSKMTAFSTPPFNATSSSVWDWSSPFYYGMARHVNLLVAITYNSGSTTGSAYETWMEGQTRSILESVYGDYCVDPRFPRIGPLYTDTASFCREDISLAPNRIPIFGGPVKVAQVYMGFPAYPNDPPNHYASAEDTEYAALGATIGTDTLNTTSVEILGVWNSFSARPTFRGAAVYLTTDGSGSDGYASWAVDWNNFAAYW